MGDKLLLRSSRGSTTTAVLAAAASNPAQQLLSPLPPYLYPNSRAPRPYVFGWRRHGAVLGRGTYGSVAAATAWFTGGGVESARGVPMKREIALKTIFPMTEAKSEVMTQAVIRELLPHVTLPPHPNLCLADAIVRVGRRVATLLPFKPHVLAPMVESASHAPVPLKLLRAWLFQLLAGLDHMHKHGMWHRDVKMENMLVDHNGTLLVADMGMARLAPLASLSDVDGNATAYVCSLWTRAWELLEPRKSLSALYTEKIDVWSAGMVALAIAAGGYVVTPDTEVEAISMIRRRLVGRPQRLRDVTARRDLPDDFFDLVSRMLVLDPAGRIGALQALQHRFFEGMSLRSALADCHEHFPSWVTRKRKRGDADGAAGAGSTDSMNMTRSLVPESTLWARHDLHARRPLPEPLAGATRTLLAVAPGDHHTLSTVPSGTAAPTATSTLRPRERPLVPALLSAFWRTVPAKKGTIASYFDTIQLVSRAWHAPLDDETLVCACASLMSKVHCVSPLDVKHVGAYLGLPKVRLSTVYNAEVEVFRFVDGMLVLPQGERLAGMVAAGRRTDRAQAAASAVGATSLVEEEDEEDEETTVHHPPPPIAHVLACLAYVTSRDGWRHGESGPTFRDASKLARMIALLERGSTPTLSSTVSVSSGFSGSSLSVPSDVGARDAVGASPERRQESVATLAKRLPSWLMPHLQALADRYSTGVPVMGAQRAPWYLPATRTWLDDTRGFRRLLALVDAVTRKSDTLRDDGAFLCTSSLAGSSSANSSSGVESRSSWLDASSDMDDVEAGGQRGKGGECNDDREATEVEGGADDLGQLNEFGAACGLIDADVQGEDDADSMKGTIGDDGTA